MSPQCVVGAKKGSKIEIFHLLSQQVPDEYFSRNSSNRRDLRFDGIFLLFSFPELVGSLGHHAIISKSFKDKNW